MNNRFQTRAFIFDMDGTLVDNMRFHAAAWQEMLTENNVEMDAEQFLVKTAGKTNREILPQVFGDISDERIAELAERKEFLYRELFLPERRTVAGAIEFLEAAQNLNVKTAVATAAPPANVEFILDGLNLRRFFGAVVTADDVREGKPNPEIFLKCAEKLGIAPPDCLVFEDALNGFEAARRAGMKAVAITTVNNREKLQNVPNVVEIIDDFTVIAPRETVEKHLSLASATAN